MSGNVPYCPGLSGVQILSGYDNNAQEWGTITFSTPFTSPPSVFMTMIISKQFSFTNCVTGVTNTTFSYIKKFNRTGNAASEPFYWMAIGDTAESGNVPYYPGSSGMNIQFGYNNTVSQGPSVTFSSPYLENPAVFMTMVTGGTTGFTCSLWHTGISKTSFGTSKHFSGDRLAASEPFYWLAIGESSLNNGNVPITSQHSGMKILTGYDATDIDESTITFSAAFSTVPVVLMSISQGGDATFMINLTEVTQTYFKYSKWFAGVSAAASEDMWWMAIGGA
jgi:hypothetical protein